MPDTSREPATERLPDLASLSSGRGSRFLSPWAISIYLLVAFILFTRLFNLGLKPVQHDESMFAYYSWLPFEKMPKGWKGFFDLKTWDTVRGAYQYDPLLHGPVLEWVTAAMFFIFGDSDYSMRLFPALCGIGVLWILFLLRREIGERAAWLGIFFLAISPSYTYLNRYIRPDLLIFFNYMLILHAGWRYSQKHSPFWLAWLVFVCWVATTVHETYVIFFFLIATFGLGCWIHGFAQRKRYAELAFWLSWLVALLAVEYWLFKRSSPISRYFYVALAFLVPGVATGWWLQRFVKISGFSEIPFCREIYQARNRNWWKFWIAVVVGNGLGFLFSYTLMTSFFKYPSHWDGQYEAWVYWAGEHAKHRIFGLFHYHLPILLWYELPLFLFFIICLLKELYPTHRDSGLTARRIIVLSWTLISLLLLLLPAWWTENPRDQFWNVALPPSWDKEIHITMGFHIWMFFEVLIVVCVVGWKHLNQGRYFLAFVDYWACGSLLAYSYAGEKVPWVTVHIVLPMLIACGIYAADLWARWFSSQAGMREKDRYAKRPTNARILPKIGLVAATVIGVGWTLWVHVISVFLQPGSPIERLSYASSHTQFHAVTRHMIREMEDNYQGLETPIAFGGQVSWPLHWIFRNYKNTTVFSYDIPNKSWSPNTEELMVTMRSPLGPQKEAQFVVIDSDMMDAWSPRPRFKDNYQWGKSRFRHYWQAGALNWGNMMQFGLFLRDPAKMEEELDRMSKDPASRGASEVKALEKLKADVSMRASGVKDWKKLLVAYFLRDEELSRDKARYEWYTMGGFYAYYGRLLPEAPPSATPTAGR